MKKMLMKTYIYVMYVLALPIFAVFSIVLLTCHCIGNKQCYGEYDVKDSLEAYIAGCKLGYMTTMDAVDHLCN